jgi:hypothetical protein
MDVMARLWSVRPAAGPSKYAGLRKQYTEKRM